MKSILFIHSSAELYGSDKSLLNIIKNISRKKFRIYVLLPAEGPLSDEIRKMKNVKLFIFDVAILRRKNLSIKGIIKYFLNFKKSYKYIKKIIKNNKIDIVYTNTSVVFPGAIAAKHCKIKSIWHIREIIKNSYENIVISKIVNHYADIVIANSKSTAESIRVDKKKISIVYNAVADFNSNKERKKRNKYVVGMAGRINRWKGQKLFIEAAKKVIDNIDNIEFVIAGSAYEGEEYITEQIKKYIKDNNLEHKIKLLGQVNDMKKFYESIDIFVLPSIQPEPFGLVIIEAMDCGLPVIATNHGGPVEIIENNVDGILVSYENSDEIADAIIRLASDKKFYKKISENGRRKKIKQFSIETMVNEITSIIDR